MRATVVVVACLGVAALPFVTGTVAGGTDDKYTTVKTARNGLQTVYGLVSPLDQEGKHFYLRNEDGLIEVKLAEEATVGLLFREKRNHELLAQRKVTIADTGQTFVLPESLYVKVPFRDWLTAQSTLKSGAFRDGFLYATKLPDHLPTEAEPWLAGRLAALEEGHITPTKVISIGGRTFKGTTSGHNYSEQLAGLFDHTAIKPFIHQASLYGALKGDVFLADIVLLRPIPDQTASDDPKLPRYLFIGDSISGNYGKALRDALKGKFNIHHPPTNCGSSGKGRELMQAWLGDCTQKGRHWDVISFNFGHWDSGNTKEQYQENLESIAQQLKRTGAKLIWVTTCPVPDGYEKAGALQPGNKAPGRKAGVMTKYLNPWALEVIRRHPEISVCDQWQYVTDHRETVFKEFWPKNDVHFRGERADALGVFLAEHVEKMMR